MKIFSTNKDAMTYWQKILYFEEGAVKFEFLDLSHETIDNKDTLVFICERESIGDLYQCKLFCQFYQEFIDLDKIMKNKIRYTYSMFQKVPNFFIFALDKVKKVNHSEFRNELGILCKLLRENYILDCKMITMIREIQGETDLNKVVYESIVLNNYSIASFKTDKRMSLPVLQKVAFHTEKMPSTEEINEYEVICDNVLNCRNLVNSSGKECNPDYLQKYTKRICDRLNIDYECLDEDKLKELGMNLVTATGKGSKYAPRVLILNYSNGDDDSNKITIVGKGVTFDTGGINLKPTGYIENMHNDMAGAAVALAVISIVAELKIKCNISVVIPLIENMISINALLPGEIVQSYSNKYVEIGDTDAEGRLILADAVSYAEKSMKPEYLFTVATLTGETTGTFDEFIAPFLTESDELRETIMQAALTAGEKIWPLPVAEKEFLKKLDSEIADIKNVATDYNAETIVGAIFIKQFHSIKKWLHFDIAGTAWLTKKNDAEQIFATGFGVRTLYETVKGLCKS